MNRPHGKSPQTTSHPGTESRTVPSPIRQPPGAAARGETFTQQQPGGTGDATQPPQQAEPAQEQTAAKPATHDSQPAGATTAAEANQANGGSANTPVAELEEVDAQEQGGGGKAQRPYHEGHGDQRMRGKRFKVAVQTAFGQRGWTKGEEVTWKEVAHLVGLREEDEESEWERVLQEGAQRGNRRPQARGGAPRTQPRPTTAGGTDHSPTNFTLLLNLHTLPRGAPLPTQPSPPQPQAQAPRQSKPQATAAAGGAGDPRRRRGRSGGDSAQARLQFYAGNATGGENLAIGATSAAIGATILL